MNGTVLGWVGLILAIWFTTFGLWWTILTVFVLLVFIIGVLSYIYIINKEATQIFYQYIYSDNSYISRPGLRKIVDNLNDSPKLLKCDTRLTGSQLIDESLRQIINYLIRDYLYPWYDQVSDNIEFTNEVQNTGQYAVVNVASRMKEVNWIPYLTTKLVDDAASHLRLYKQACAKVKLKQEEIKLENKQKMCHLNVGKPKSLADFKTTTEQTEIKTHSRNNSSGNSSLIIQNKSPDHSRTNSIVDGKNIKQISVHNTDKRQSDITVRDEIEKIFFDLETNMENNQICRDLICSNIDDELQYLKDLIQVLLYLVLSKNDYDCLAFKLLARDLLIGKIVLPLINILSDPDYINLTIIWLCRDIPLSSEAFLLTLRLTDNVDELQATKEMVEKEIGYLQSRDCGSETDVKQQLTSLNYLNKLLDNKINRLEVDSSGSGSGSELLQLSIEFILNNDVAQAYFIDYMKHLNLHHYLFCYISVDEWKLNIEKLFDVSDKSASGSPTRRRSRDRNKSSSPTVSPARSTISSSSNHGSRSPAASESDLNHIKQTCVNIYNKYLSDEANPRVYIDQDVVTELSFNLKQNQVTCTLFDDVQTALYDKLQNDEKFLPGFKQSKNYIRLLSDLELLHGVMLDESDFDRRSLDNVSLGDDISISSLDTHDGEDLQFASAHQFKYKEVGPFGNCKLSAEIIETGVVQDRGNTYGIYALLVCKTYDNGWIEKWHVYRRYSDFYDLQQRVKESYNGLGKLPFPSKKTFHNMERSTLDKRMKMLNGYLQILLQHSVLPDYKKLLIMLNTFLERGEYDKSGGLFAKTFESLVTPLKSSMRTVGEAVKTMPDNLMNTVDEVFDGLTKAFSNTKTKHDEDSIRVGAALQQQETADNIPLRIMLLLMDEVFDLQSRNKWLRRRIVILLKEIVRTMFGDKYNKKIVDYVADLTSPEQVSYYLNTFKNWMWPNGSKPVPPPTRDEQTKLRTKVMAKTVLLSSTSDELKHIIGSDTLRRGLLRVFNLLQHSVLNKRLLIVLVEGLLMTLFPEHKLDDIFLKIHSRSPRVKTAKSTSKKQK